MAENRDQIMVGPVAVYIGVAGEEPTTALGYTTDAGVNRTVESTITGAKVGNRLGDVKRFVSERECRFGMALLQPTMDLLAAGYPGASKASNVLSLNSTATSVQELSVKLVGLDPLGQQRVERMLWATMNIDGDVVGSIREIVSVPVVFSGLSVTEPTLSITDGAGTEAVTLSDGTFARTASQTYYRMSGEGGAADSLTDVTGSGLVNNELLILQIADADEPITVVHGAGVVELTGEVDFEMDHIDDVLYLRYQLSGAVWVEVGRFKARSDI